MSSAVLPPPSPPISPAPQLSRESDDESADTASQESVSLSSSTQSNSLATDSDPRKSLTSRSSDDHAHGSPQSSVMSSKSASPRVKGWTPMSRQLADLAELTSSSIAGMSSAVSREFKPATYPPKPQHDDALSISSFASTSSRKARPESLLIQPTTEPLILGVALVDFNHLVFRIFQSLLF